MGETVGARMPAAVYVGDGALEVHDVDVPAFGPGDVLVEVSHCWVCGTDLHLVLEQIARPGSVLGHEWAGTIVALGDGVTGWALGDRVVCGPVPGCGECRACRLGRPSVCVRRPPVDQLAFRGAFARYARAESARLLPVPDGLPTRVAALTEPVAIALHAVTLSGVTPADRVLITGAGPVGMLILAVLRAQGVHDVVVSEPAAPRRVRALEVGAAAAVVPDDLDTAPMGRPVAEPFSVVFECSGNASACERALDQLDLAGTFVFVGTGHDLPRVNHNRVIVLELTLLGAYNYDAGGWERALDLLASGSLPVEQLIHPVDVLLDDLGDDFYGDVFGWTEGDNSMEQGNPLILYTGEFAQFVYLLPGDEPLVCPRLDHFGFQVATREELVAIVERAKARRANDDRVQIIDVKSRLTHGDASQYELTSAYIGFVLPFMVEL